MTKKFSCLSMACLVWLAVRLAYNSLRQLVPDEAYYWVWSRHPAGGYLDHPPMVAWVIRAGVACFGNNEFAVRSGAALLSAGTILVLIGLIRRASSPQAARLGAAILLLGPMMAILGTIVTPDTPACFFSLCALAAAFLAARGRPVWWLVCGVCFGLAMLSKYTAVLLGGALAIALLSTRQGRRQLLSPWPWMGAIAAAGIFWPVVQWNRQHDWASFRFQWRHGAGADPSWPIANLLSFAGGQAALYTPVLFVLGLIALAWRWRQVKSLDTADRMILMAASLPLLFFGLFSLRHRPEANWPIFAFLPMTAILAQWAQQFRAARWTGIGLIVAASMMVVGQLPEIVYLAPLKLLPNIPNPWEEMFGWRDFGRALDQRGAGAVVFCTTYENAAEASFYMSNQPMVWTIDTSRPTAFDFFAGRPSPASLPKVLCVTRAGSEPDVPAELRSFPDVTRQSWQTTALGRVVRRRQFIIARNRSS